LRCACRARSAPTSSAPHQAGITGHLAGENRRQLALVKTTGDGMLAEFASAVDAVEVIDDAMTVPTSPTADPALR
jgi:class 3 adenylate cyclase